MMVVHLHAIVQVKSKVSNEDSVVKAKNAFLGLRAVVSL